MTLTPDCLADLPREYLEALNAQHMVPLWPSLRALLPHGIPTRKTQPARWRYADVRPNLLRAGELTPIEKAERRVLVLCNPGLGLEQLRATPSIYIGLQLILPGETAPSHRHTPAAVRVMIEGSGCFTLVDGEKLPMEKGDVILTPSGTWHEHGHEGSGPCIWMDALDLPLIYDLEASYSQEGPAQEVNKLPGSGAARFARAGLIGYGSLDRPATPYPLLRFAWREVKVALAAAAELTPVGEPVHLAYVNPQTGRECLPTLGLSALQVRPLEHIRLSKRSASAAVLIVEGSGTALISGTEHPFEEADILVVPTHSAVSFFNRSSLQPAYLLMVDDAPLQRRLGIYHTFESRQP